MLPPPPASLSKTPVSLPVMYRDPDDDRQASGHKAGEEKFHMPW